MIITVLLCHKGTLVAHGQCSSPPSPQFLSEELLSKWLDPNVHWYVGLFLPRRRIWHFPFLDLSEVPVYPVLHLVQGILDDSKHIWCIICSSQFANLLKIQSFLLSRLLEKTLNNDCPQYTNDLHVANLQRFEPSSAASFQFASLYTYLACTSSVCQWWYYSRLRL